jgi:Sulfotransferase family
VQGAQREHNGMPSGAPVRLRRGGSRKWASRFTVSYRTRPIDRPIFVIGMPRSGTTLLFTGLAVHPQLAWFSQYMHLFPRLTPLAALGLLGGFRPGAQGVAGRGQKRSRVDRLRVTPSEAAGRGYGIWAHCCGERFRFDFLLGAEPSATERDCLRSKVSTTTRLQRKSRFVGKLTGPARIGYLSGIFEDALFLHVTRDSRAVVESLSRVPFWRDTSRSREPAWPGGLRPEDLDRWHQHGDSPAALAAVEWRAVLELAREEAASVAPDRYAEVRYEDFVMDPHAVLDEIFAFAQLPPDPYPHEFVNQQIDVRDVSSEWRQRLPAEDAAVVDEVTGDTMREFGYSLDRPISVRSPLARPFAGAESPQDDATNASR